MAAGRKPKFVMRPPQVLRVGTKKTSFANFTDICKTLHRQPKHLLDFLLAELGTSGSMDGNQQLIIKGRFQPKQIENVLRRYVYHSCETNDRQRSKLNVFCFLFTDTSKSMSRVIRAVRPKLFYRKIHVCSSCNAIHVDHDVRLQVLNPVSRQSPVSVLLFEPKLHKFEDFFLFTKIVSFRLFPIFIIGSGQIEQRILII